MQTNFQPLYKQVYDLITARVVSGEWKPAQSLPSELALADELGVSQGTVRKALNQMVSEKLLDRRQGRGTYVAEHTQESSLFRFFRHRQADGASLIPETKVLSIKRSLASERAQKKLALDANSELVQMTRLRSLLGKPAIIETINQPLSIFPDIDLEPEIPNSLYTLYQIKFGVSIVEVCDELHATTVPDEYAELLLLPLASPVLKIDRSSYDMKARVVEWSESYCSSEHFVYNVKIK